jgi:terminase, large subunit
MGSTRWPRSARVVATSAPHALHALADRIRDALALYVPSPIVPGVAWLEANMEYEVEGGGTAPFRFDDVPALREPFEEATKPGGGRFCLVKPIQSAATTTFAIGLVLHKLCTDPANVIVTQPTVDDAQKFSKTKLDPILEASPLIDARFTPARGRDKASTILIKRAIGGILFMVGTNSPRMMRMTSAPLIVNDEVSAYPRNAGGEGSVLAKAWGRSTGFEDPRQFMLSTPLLKGDCLITEQYEQSDQRIFEVRCPHCRAYFAPTWPMVKWLKVVEVDGDVTETRADVVEGEVVRQHLAQTAYLECPLCACAIAETVRRAVVTDHRYRVQRPDVTDFKGWKYNFYASLMPGMRLAALVPQFLRAVRDPEEMQQFVNEIEAEVYSGAGSTLDLNAIKDRREVYPAEVPKQVGFLTAFVDVQGDRLELLVVGWGAAQESWVIGLVRIDGDPTEESDECWRTLTMLRKRAYQHEGGAPLYIQWCGIDRGFSADSVEAYVKTHQRENVIQTIGKNRFDKPVLIRQSRKRKDGQQRVVPLYHIGTDTAKDRLFQRLKRESGAGAIHFPTHFPDDAVAQFGAEVAVSRRVRNGADAGRSVRFYRKVEDRNESIDLMVGNMAMLSRAGDAVKNNLHALALRVQAEGDARGGVPKTPPTPSPFTAPLSATPPAPERSTLPTVKRRRVLSRGLK